MDDQTLNAYRESANEFVRMYDYADVPNEPFLLAFSGTERILDIGCGSNTCSIRQCHGLEINLPNNKQYRPGRENRAIHLERFAENF